MPCHTTYYPVFRIQCFPGGIAGPLVDANTPTTSIEVNRHIFLSKSQMFWHADPHLSAPSVPERTRPIGKWVLVLGYQSIKLPQHAR
jgi:hypothetical protein